MVEILYSAKFEKMYKKLPASVKCKAEAKEYIFRSDPFSVQLKTHKLTGGLRCYWAFWIDYHYRIVFSFSAKDEVTFHAIGTHDIYKYVFS